MEIYPQIYLYRRIVKAKLFIDDNYSNAIDLDRIADEAFFSKFHFIRIFKKIYGKTPHQYLTYVRIERSKILLDGSMSISEVCYEVGFDSITSFTGLFKRIAGQTPAAYQLHCYNRKQEIKKIPLK